MSRSAWIDSELTVSIHALLKGGCAQCVAASSLQKNRRAARSMESVPGIVLSFQRHNLYSCVAYLIEEAIDD